MSLHKLTAGDGYEYLTRQVAAMDSTEKGASALADYYSAKGESPGRWMGTGLAALANEDPASVVAVGEEVGADQMKALFGEGRHPNADQIERTVAEAAMGRGLERDAATRQGLAHSMLGQPFPVYEGASAFRKAVGQAFTDYNTEHNERWNAPIDPEKRAELRTRVAQSMFVEEYGRPPLNDRELSGFVAKGSRQKTTAVAGYDLTFSPVKSVSTLWAVAPRDVSQTVEEAHQAAVEHAVRFLEDNATYTRTGHAGVAQVDTQGLMATAFTHRDARSGDPDLHTHVAVSNKVATRTPNGELKWLALDGRVLHKMAVAASEVYNSAIEREMYERLGCEFSEREPAERGKRTVREIDGVDTRLNEVWSSRRAAIDQRRGELAQQFQATHGRAPTNAESLALAQRANLETRQAKHEPRSLAEQRAEWRTTALRVLGGRDGLSSMVRRATSPRRRRRMELTDQWIEATADHVIATVAESRSRWQPAHIIAEAQRQIRSAGIVSDDTDTAVDAVVTAALGSTRSLLLGPSEDLGEPDQLLRSDWARIYT
ncbi:MAG: relaxase domain-containing protein, partial [Tomitella sp.]|nr:relaxase domain-containing protein [Tomitella sp.]